jgi:hypothetical protein
LKLITQFAQSRSLEVIYQKYGCPIRVGLRDFQNDGIRRLCMHLSMMIKHSRVGGNGIMVLNAGYILEAAEPLETLESTDASAYKMRVLVLLYKASYAEAQHLVDDALARYRGDPVLRRMRTWLDKEMH